MRQERVGRTQPPPIRPRQRCGRRCDSHAEDFRRQLAEQEANARPHRAAAFGKEAASRNTRGVARGRAARQRRRPRCVGCTVFPFAIQSECKRRGRTSTAVGPQLSVLLRTVGLCGRGRLIRAWCRLVEGACSLHRGAVSRWMACRRLVLVRSHKGQHVPQGPSVRSRTAVRGAGVVAKRNGRAALWWRAKRKKTSKARWNENERECRV
mmetsp:Transcript_13297/g.41359  ORF Transcript_13297/g.41359 Transcript_13297/m.41359 type:complete len:209 (-) Transcript_13297:470-1096(-)